MVCFLFSVVVAAPETVTGHRGDRVTSDADMKLDMNHIQSIFVKASVRL